MRVDLRWYDHVVVNTSAGKDSQAMTDWVVRLAERAGVKGRVVAVHCVIPEEWEGTRELAEEHARHYGLRFEVVKREQGGILEHVMQRHESLRAAGRHGVPPWPSSTSRYCTSQHKTGQVARLFTRLAAESRAAGLTRRVRILNCLGIRAAESCTRSKLRPFKLDRAASNGRRTVHTWLPLFGWSVGMVWSRIRHAGTRSHPAYQLGMPRLSCCFCVLSPRNALMLAGTHNRDLLDRYVEVEDEVGFTFQQGLSLREVRDAIDRGEQPGQIRTWEA